jgi:glutathione S-transferase
MKLFYSSTSPYVRKVMIVAHELGLAGRIEMLACAAHPINRDPAILAENPLGQVPTLLTDDGIMVADSRVICAYLDTLADGKLTPSDAAARLRAETEQALADGILGAALILRYETVVRPEALRWADWISGQWNKIATTLAHFEAHPPGKRVDIGSITLAAALSYLDLRFADFAWRSKHPALAAWYAGFAERPSMVATALKG